MAACQNLLIRFTTASFMSPTADASVCTAKKLISARSSQDKPWGSKKSKKVFGWSALWSTISATSIWRKKLCSLSTTLLAQKCNLCLRYDLSPMSPGRTRERWSREWELNPRPADYESAALPLSYLGLAQKTTLASAENRSQFYRKLCFCGDCSRNALNVRTDTWPSRSR